MKRYNAAAVSRAIGALTSTVPGGPPLGSSSNDLRACIKLQQRSVQRYVGSTSMDRAHGVGAAAATSVTMNWNRPVPLSGLRSRIMYPAHSNSTGRNQSLIRNRNYTAAATHGTWPNRIMTDFDDTLSVDEAFTPPASWYRDEDVLAREKETLFRTSWLNVARTDQLQHPGDYVADCRMNQPFIVCVDEEGTIRAFYNVCRHHATRVVPDGAGKGAKSFVCPYHGWTYSTDGRLRKATRLKGIKHFRASRNGLIPIDVSVLGPHIYIRFTSKSATADTDTNATKEEGDKKKAAQEGGAATAAAALYTSLPVKELKARLRQRGLRLSGNKAELVARLMRETGGVQASAAATAQAASDSQAMSLWELDEHFGKLYQLLDDGGLNKLAFVKRVVYPIKCNWKVFVDNYLDGGYHVSVAHPALAGALDLESYETTVFPRYSTQTVLPAKEGASERIAGGGGGGDNAASAQRATYAWLYPNLMINRYGPWADTNVVWPKGPRECEVIFDYYLDAEYLASVGGPDGDFVTQSLKDSDVVQQEDIELCEAVQAGLDSDGYDKGRYAPNVEFGMHAFHQLLAKELQGVAVQ